MVGRPLAALLLAATTCLAGCTQTVRLGNGWTAHCSSVAEADCMGIAELFVSNLAWSHDFIRHESGGVIRVSPMGPCPPVDAWADPTACWRADAPTRTNRACMVIARSRPEAGAELYFGQVAGDDFSGRVGAPRPGTTPC